MRSHDHSAVTHVSKSGWLWELPLVVEGHTADRSGRLDFYKISSHFREDLTGTSYVRYNTTILTNQAGASLNHL